jgi:chromate transporter
MAAADHAAGDHLTEVATLFLKLGFTAFGGPAAHVAMMRDEVVRRRKWISEQQFLDLLGVSNLIPGPTSTELAIFLGYQRAGWRGLLLAGSLFILPATIIVLVLAWAYVQYGSTPQVVALFYGIKPVIIAIIVQALWGLTKTAVKTIPLAMVGLAVLALSLLAINPIALLFGAGLLVMIVQNLRRLRAGKMALVMPALRLRAPSAVHLAAAAAAVFSLSTLFLTFLKIGATVYGSGYVLLAYLHDDFVDGLGWLTNRQLIDAVAVGQFTPGPVFTTATFIGYLVGGLPGAIVATVGIFLPSFILVALLFPVAPRLRASPWTSAFLDGVNVAAVGLIAAITLQLAQAALVDPLTVALALIALGLLLRLKLNSAWLVLGGAAIGLLNALVR